MKNNEKKNVFLLNHLIFRNYLKLKMYAILVFIILQQLVKMIMGDIYAYYNLINIFIMSINLNLNLSYLTYPNNNDNNY